MKIWVSRDKVDTYQPVAIWSYQPPHKNTDGTYVDGHEDCCCMWCGSAKEFKKEFDFTPRNGTCKQWDMVIPA